MSRSEPRGSAPRLLRGAWARFLPRARITLRIITAVVLAMSVVLIAAGAFVFWRISYALDNQLDQDLAAYTKAVEDSLDEGSSLPTDNPDLVAQTYRPTGELVATSDDGVRRLLTAGRASDATTSEQTFDVGHLLPPPSDDPYRIRYQLVQSSDGEVVLVTAISRHKHDEALRELLLQLAVADLATILAAGVVGWGATRAALGPVERYRRAAADAEGDPGVRLPIDPSRNDELTRLGTTFNDLLTQIEAGHRRERQFLADASHELRSPLALLAAEVEWARHRPRTPEQVDEVLTSVGAQTQRLVNLADALLNLEEVSEPGRGTVDAVTLSDLVAAAAAPNEAAAGAQRRTVSPRVADATVHVEIRWVELALSNLIGNALRHGEGTVTVRAHVVDDRIEFAVTDEGTGVPASLGAAAFERFARAEESRTTPGNGLGLAIVAAVAERHRGRVALIPGGVRLTLTDLDGG